MVKEHDIHSMYLAKLNPRIGEKVDRWLNKTSKCSKDSEEKLYETYCLVLIKRILLDGKKI